MGNSSFFTFLCLLLNFVVYFVILQVPRLKVARLEVLQFELVKGLNSLDLDLGGGNCLDILGVGFGVEGGGGIIRGFLGVHLFIYQHQKDQLNIIFD